MIMYLYFYLVAFSLVGYGFLSSRFLNIDNNNFGILGLLGIINIAVISYGTSLFIKHGLIFNSAVLLIGVILFFLNLKRLKNLKKELIYFILIFSILLLFITIGKNHDDFPYYHFPYIQLLNDYPHPFGLGQLNNGFRSPSSVFFISSIFFLPKIGIYLFHILPALILGFANIFLIKNIFDKENFQKKKIISYLSILFFSFINIFFYRLAEHGTDRSGMILILISIICLISLTNKYNLIKSKNQNNENLMKIIIILICFAATIKPYFLINFLFFFSFIYFKQTRKIFLDLFFTRTFYFCLTLIFFLLYYTFINSGCLVFPIKITCFENLSWSINKELVTQTSIWFELWSKGGANPNLVVDDRLEYISGFNWVANWFDNYFFNKVLDFIVGVLFLSLIIFFIYFKKKKLGNVKIKNIFFIYFIILLLLLEWFFKHPTLRYGGYHLIALVIFVPLSLKLSNINIDYNFFIKRSFIVIFLVITIFSARNLIRLNNENSLYGFNPIKNPNYKFIGGDENFYYRYNEYIKKNFENFETIELIGQKILVIKK